jgi:hypothetical protein
VQLRFQTTLTSETYVKQRAWERANLEHCPAHPGGGCGMRVHSPYARKHPVGVQIARYYCRKARQTFSLLPDFLAAKFSNTLAEVEAVVTVVETSRSLAAAARELRPELVDERHAIRWVRRRLGPVRAALMALVTLLPELFGCAPRLSAIGSQLGVDGVLERVRAIGTSFLGALCAPLGFVRRAWRSRTARQRLQQKAGPDPPTPTQ